MLSKDDTSILKIVIRHVASSQTQTKATGPLNQTQHFIWAAKHKHKENLSSLRRENASLKLIMFSRHVKEYALSPRYASGLCGPQQDLNHNILSLSLYPIKTPISSSIQDLKSQPPAYTIL